MKRVFIYKAEIYCGDCGNRLVEKLKAGEGIPQRFTVTETDSDSWPQAAMIGEADSPQHCAACGEFLENPLTPDGDSYVREAATEFESPGDTWEEIASKADSAGKATLADWIRFYLAPGQ